MVLALSISTLLFILIAFIRLEVRLSQSTDHIISRGIHIPFSKPLSEGITTSIPPPARHFVLAEIGHVVDNYSLPNLAPPPRREGKSHKSVTASALESLLGADSNHNPVTSHIRIPNIIQNISLSPSNKPHGAWQTFNPTIMPLPYWSPNQYLIVSRVVTEGLHQESLMCEANTCYAGGVEGRRPGEKNCDNDDIVALGPAGGLRCSHEPILLNIPTTPSEQCTGSWTAFPNIPGFHDPRIFWSGKGEPLIIVNSHSRYACFGLWITDLRNLYDPLTSLLSTVPDEPTTQAPLISYPFLTELTRNPKSTRNEVEKNWFLFFPTPSTSYLHYHFSSPTERLATSSNGTQFIATSEGRSFAKLVGNGFTTPNLTSSLESPCLLSSTDSLNRTGRWHQASNSLKLVLCHRAEVRAKKCKPDEPGRTVHFAIVHRKFSNDWDLPLRYERYFMLWDAKPPFAMRGMSRYPVQFWNETASGWSGEENWKSDLRMNNEAQSSSPSVKKTSYQNLTSNATTGLLHREPLIFTNGTVASPATDHAIKQENNTTHAGDTHAHTHNIPQDTPLFSIFTYTPSIAWAWRPKTKSLPLLYPLNPFTSSNRAAENIFATLQTGYLDDEVILGIGVDDTQQGFGRAKAERLLQGLRICPGLASSAKEGERDEEGKEATNSDKGETRGEEGEERMGMGMGMTGLEKDGF